jgi:hypothetical protein
MRNDTTYNGWTNYETWAAKLWIDNDQGEQEIAEEIVTSEHTLYDAGNALKDYYEESMPDLGANMFADLLRSAFDSVNWQEIAEAIQEDYDDEQEYEDNSCGQCNASMINGIYCHETGCLNRHRVKVDGEWVDPEPDDDSE